jgi:hypothetical protein
MAAPTARGMLDEAKAAVFVSLRSTEPQRSYQRSINEFVGWYHSEPHHNGDPTVSD